MSEKTDRGLVVKALVVFDAVAVENPAFPGTPDVNSTLGWIELKNLPNWPRIAPDKPVLVPKFTQQQRIWLIRRTRVGGLADLLLKVGQEWLLFDGRVAAEIVGRVPKAELIRRAVAIWPSNRAMRELLPQCLLRRHTSLLASDSPSGGGGGVSPSPRPRSSTVSASTPTEGGSPTPKEPKLRAPSEELSDPTKPVSSSAAALGSTSSR